VVQIMAHAPLLKLGPIRVFRTSRDYSVDTKFCRTKSRDHSPFNLTQPTLATPVSCRRGSHKEKHILLCSK